MRPYGPQHASLLCLWDSPGKHTGVGCHALLQKIFPTQETPRDRSNLHLLHFLHWQVGSLPLLDSSIGEESACNAGDLSSIPGSGRAAGEGIDYPLQYSWASLVAWSVKNLPAVRETWVQSLSWEDSPGGGHGNPLQYSCLENPHAQRSLAGYSPERPQRIGHD